MPKRKCAFSYEVFPTIALIWQASLSFQNRHLFYTQMGDLDFSSHLAYHFCSSHVVKIFNVLVFCDFLLFREWEWEMCSNKASKFLFISLQHCCPRPAESIVNDCREFDQPGRDFSSYFKALTFKGRLAHINFELTPHMRLAMKLWSKTVTNSFSMRCDPKPLCRMTF